MAVSKLLLALFMISGLAATSVNAQAIALLKDGTLYVVGAPQGVLTVEAVKALW